MSDANDTKNNAFPDRPEKNTAAADHSQFTGGPAVDAESPLLDSPDSAPDAKDIAGGYRITPMFRQYLEVKRQYPDALLFYRMGDFYELFFEDAGIAARELQLALTSRNRGDDNPIPMCGVPWRAMESYAAQLIDKGYSIAVCDQTEDPRHAKGLVSRAVTRVVTPGTVLDDANLDSKAHNYLGSFFPDGDSAGFVWADITTGQWSGLEARTDTCWQWILKFAPRELLLPEGAGLPEDADLTGIRLVRRRKGAFDARQAEERILACQQVADLSALGMQDKPLLTRAAGALLTYLTQTQKRNPDHMLPFRPLDTCGCLIIDDVTERNLELFQRLNGARGKGTLVHVMDATVTPMGGRLLEDCLKRPLRDPAAITRIQDAVEYLCRDDKKRAVLREALEGVFDLERLSTRIHMNRALPRDFAALKNSLEALPKVEAALTMDTGRGSGVPPFLQELLEGWDNLDDCRDLLTRALRMPPPQVITDGGIFAPGYNAELDALLDLSEHGEKKLREMFERDQERAGCKLKFGSNRVFGYYYEISRGQKVESLPEDFARRQTLTTGERYTTPGLRELEERILEAGEKQRDLEYRLFQELRNTVAAQRGRLLSVSRRIARLDYWQSLAEKARQNGWTRPVITDSPNLSVQEGRHPVVEEVIGQANFVPNSFVLDKNRRLCLLTGPNMAGKSTILRQIAIICIMAQMGSFVPASAAEIGLVDRLFSRVGASDNLARGQSTFMVEMMETARILRQSGRRSLIILDEIGRGTSTYDGLALAWAVAEDLAQRFGGSLRTLFATHYHELTQLEGQVPGVFTMNIAVQEHNKSILFLHRLLPGPTDKSYGVEVARLAGVPRSVVNRARDLLGRFEAIKKSGHKAFREALSPGLLPGLPDQDEKAGKEKHERVLAEPGVQVEQKVKEHPLVQILRDLNPEALTPMQALSLITEWKSLWGGPAGEESRQDNSEKA